MNRSRVDGRALIREYLGRWPLVTGTLSLWIGLLLIFIGPASGQGIASYLHRAAYEGIAIGIFLLLVGFAVRRASR